MHVANLGDDYGGKYAGGAVSAVWGPAAGKAVQWLVDAGNEYLGPRGYTPGAAVDSSIDPCRPPKDTEGEPPYSTQQRATWKQACALYRAQRQVEAERRTLEVVEEMEDRTWYKQTRYYLYAAGALVIGAAVIRAVRR